MAVAAFLTIPASASAATSILTDLAGTGSAGAPVAGPATSSSLRSPSGVAVDSNGNVYIADTANNEVEKVTPAGVISVIAGTGAAGRPTPGPATASALNGPTGRALASNNTLYIADSGNNEVEQVTTSGTLSIVAGTGTAGSPTYGAAGTSSALNDPQGLAVGSGGAVFIADTGNNVIEKLTIGGNLTQLAGTGTAGPPTAGPGASSNLSSPRGLAITPANNIVVADTGNNDVEQVTNASKSQLTILAGTGSPGAPKAGTATSSSLNAPAGVGFDAAGDLYIADTGNDDLEEVNTSGVLSVVDGKGAAGVPNFGAAPSSSALNAPIGVASDADGDMDIVDSGNDDVEQIQPPAFLLTTSATPAFSDSLNAGDGAPTYTLPTFVQNSGSSDTAGWNLTATSTQFTTGGSTPTTLPTTASTFTGVSSACAAASCTAPTNQLASTIGLPAGSGPPTAVKFFQAQPGTGTGALTITPTVSVAVPQNAFAGSYTSTVTVSLVSGP